MLNDQPPPAFAAPEALLIDDRASAVLLGISRATWHRLRAAGKLPPAVRLGRCLRWRRAEFVAWVEAACPDARTWAAMTAAAGRRGKTRTATQSV